MLDRVVHKIASYRLQEKAITVRVKSGSIKTSEPDIKCLMELRLIECFWETLKAIAKRDSVVETWVHVVFRGSHVQHRTSVANSGKLIHTALSLYDKQVILLNLILRGYEGVPSKEFKYERIQESGVLLFVRFVIVRMLSKITSLLRVILRKQEIWRTGIVSEIDFPPTGVKSKEISTLDGFNADPFLFTNNDEKFIFVETMNNGKGEIHSGKIFNGQICISGAALVESFHLSFPFVFEYENSIYLLPESSAANQIRLYKTTNFPSEWSLHCLLMEDISSVDSFLIHKSDTWFLFTNLSSGLVSEFGSELWLFTSDSLTSNNWAIHPKSPISMEAEYSRNGGYYKKEGAEYRVNQIPGFSRYGFGLRINKIEELSLRTYVESKEELILGGFNESHTGNHHLSYSDGMYAFDFTSLGKNKK